eukprot:PITA_32140
MARILVDLDTREGLEGKMTLRWGSYRNVQPLDYEGVPFRCNKCRQIGHVYMNCPLVTCQKGMPKQTHPSAGKDHASASIPSRTSDRTIERRSPLQKPAPNPPQPENMQQRNMSPPPMNIDLTVAADTSAPVSHPTSIPSTSAKSSVHYSSNESTMIHCKIPLPPPAITSGPPSLPFPSPPSSPPSSKSNPSHPYSLRPRSNRQDPPSSAGLGIVPLDPGLSSSRGRKTNLSKAIKNASAEVISYNCRGLASSPKRLALKRLFEVENPDIILLQETLGSSEDCIRALSTVGTKWNYIAADAVGRSGGLAFGYNPTTIKLDSSWGGQGFLGADILCSELGSPLRIVNIYGPCHHRDPFWRNLLSKNLLASDSTIIGGDLNFSIGFFESWGAAAQRDPISDYISGLLEQHDFIDIPVQKKQPTWRNRRTGHAALARRLDRFLMKGPLVHRLQSFKQWVCTGGLSDHHPIAMEILGPHQKPKAPYKFNHQWLLDPSFNGMITSYWKAHPIDREPSFARGFVKNLTELKHLAISWAKEKKKGEDERLAKIEMDLENLLDERNLGFISQEDKNTLVELENQKNIILKGREESLRLHSRAIWLKAGDENSRFFHNFAKGRKVANTIWNLPLPEGGMADTFNKLSNLGTSYFRNLYKNPADTNLAEIINVAGHFPRFIEEEDAADLEAPVTMAELESTIKWFKKEKSPGPDGWTIEFYASFFDLLGEDILKVVEESRTTGSMYHAINTTFIALIPKSDHPSSFDDFRPISLCNVLYKITSKIIANRIKPILSRHISPQQFAFLENRQIHEAIGSAQEAIHSIWTKRLRCILLKIDLSKAFDRVS